MLIEQQIQEKLQQFYQNKYPKRTITVNLSEIPSGWETDIYHVTITEDGNPRERILRVYHGDNGSQKSEKEFNAMKTLYDVGFPVPRVYLLESDTTKLGNAFVIMEKINGELMSHIMKKSEKAEVITQFCTLFCDLHKIDWQKFADPSLYPGSYAFITNYLLNAEKYITTFNINEFTPVLDWLKKRRSAVPCTRLSVTHGDYHADNIIVQDDKKAVVIDWSNVSVADFRLDVAWTLLLMGTYGKAQFRTIILAEYERIAGAKIEQIEYFDVLASLRRLFSILVSLKKGANALGMRPGAESMMKNAGHINRVYSLLYERTGITIPEVEDFLSTLP
jgi:aminoglycoside phosphotransferase (APT) family kinase protein